MLDGLETRKTAHICLGVCTYQRPEMLLRCLLSIRRLAVPADVRLTVLVVDNEPTPASAELAYSFNDGVPEVCYEHQPRRGISHARNMVLDRARAMGADWVAMLDDDQTVPTDWLRQMWWVAKGLDADIVWNCIDLDWPEPLPAWAFPRKRPHQWGIGIKMADAGGVLFRADLRGTDRQPLRFGSEFALTGGEDGDFFKRATLAGALIVRNPRAISVEHLPASKCTYRAQVGRAYWIAMAIIHRGVRFDGRAKTTAKGLASVANSLFASVGDFLLVPFVAPLDRRRARRKVLKGSKKLAKAAGISAALLGLARPQPYRTIHGS